MTHHTPAAVVNGLSGVAARHKVAGYASRVTGTICKNDQGLFPRRMVVYPVLGWVNSVKGGGRIKTYDQRYSLHMNNTRHVFGHKVSGVVMSGGLPVQDAFVTLMNKMSHMVVDRVRTGVDGAYLFKDLPVSNDPHVLIAFHPVLGTFNPSASEEIYSVPM